MCSTIVLVSASSTRYPISRLQWSSFHNASSLAFAEKVEAGVDHCCWAERLLGALLRFWGCGGCRLGLGVRVRVRCRCVGVSCFWGYGYAGLRSRRRDFPRGAGGGGTGQVWVLRRDGLLNTILALHLL